MSYSNCVDFVFVDFSSNLYYAIMYDMNILKCINLRNISLLVQDGNKQPILATSLDVTVSLLTTECSIWIIVYLNYPQSKRLKIVKSVAVSKMRASRKSHQNKTYRNVNRTSDLTKSGQSLDRSTKLSRWCLDLLPYDFLNNGIPKEYYYNGKKRETGQARPVIQSGGISWIWPIHATWHVDGIPPREKKKNFGPTLIFL